MTTQQTLDYPLEVAEKILASSKYFTELVISEESYYKLNLVRSISAHNQFW